MLNVYAFRDKKSDVLSNHFISGEPFSKIKQNISVSLLQLSLKEPSNPFVLFSEDYQLVCTGSMCTETMESEFLSKFESVELSELLAASRKAFDLRNNHTSPTEVQENDLE